jgi:hypothetical protein
MINVAEVVNDPDFAQAFTIVRDAGSWVSGNWISNTTNISAYGVIQSPTGDELEQIPEADRVKGNATFHSSQEIFETNTTGISDTITWHGNTYKIVKVYDWADFGYYKAVGVRVDGV